MFRAGRDAQKRHVIFIGHGFGPVALVALVIVGSLVFFGPLGPALLVFLLPPLLLVGLFSLVAGRRSRGQVEAGGWEPEPQLEPAPPFDEVREAAKEDLLALADDIRALDIELELPDVDPEAKRDYAAALDFYERASRAFDRARRPADLEAVSEAVADGRFAIATVNARLQRRPLPERRPSCFFDPRHGPSVRDVEWAPPGGTPRPVPACAADAISIEEGYEPHAREVVVHGERRPYWDAPAYFAPWAGGFFGGSAAALVPALFFGSILGAGLGVGGSVVFDDASYEPGDDLGDEF